MAAVYVPTNHLYLGDILIVRMSDLRYPALTVEQAIRVFPHRRHGPARFGSLPSPAARLASCSPSNPTN